MFGLGLSEILVIAVIAIVFIGPDQLPDVARTIGRFLNDLKRSTDSLKDDFKSQINLDLEERKREIFSNTHPMQTPLPPADAHIAPHETDPMLSSRQHELNHLEHSAALEDHAVHTETIAEASPESSTPTASQTQNDQTETHNNTQRKSDQT